MQVLTTWTLRWLPNTSQMSDQQSVSQLPLAPTTPVKDNHAAPFQRHNVCKCNNNRHSVCKYSNNRHNVCKYNNNRHNVCKCNNNRHSVCKYSNNRHNVCKYNNNRHNVCKCNNNRHDVCKYSGNHRAKYVSGSITYIKNTVEVVLLTYTAL